MIPNRKVLDLSHHNAIASWADIKAAGIAGVIHKATEGTTYTDPQYLRRAAPAMRAGLQWGAYHFAHAGNVQAQVDHFLSVVGVDSETLYALDWEDPPTGSRMQLEQARQFLQLNAQRIGPDRCVIYSANCAKEDLGNQQNTFFGAHRLWLAQYSNTPTIQQSWPTWWLWQYSDGKSGPQPHGCPGVTGEVDTNSWPGTDTELITQWSSAPASAPPTATINNKAAGKDHNTIHG